MDTAARTAEVPHQEGLDVFVVNASDPMIGFYGGPTFWSLPGPTVASWRLLSMAKCEHVVTRTGPHRFELALVDGRMFEAEHELLFRSALAPLKEGDEVTVGDARIQVLALSGGKPVRIGVTTARPLDDPGYAFVTWRDGAIKRIAFPRDGESVRLPWSPGPLGL